MTNKILPTSENVVFEPHSLKKTLPFIFHTDRPKAAGLCNIHENFEILYVSEGKGKLRLDGSEWQIVSGDVLAINCYSVHQVTNLGGLTYHCLIIDTSFCEENELDIKGLSFVPLIRDEQLTKLMDRVVEEFQSEQPFRQTGIKSAVLESMLYLCRRYALPSGSQAVAIDNRAERIYRTMEYIKKNPEKKLTLEGVSAFAGFSKYYFSREFKKMLGMTLMQYVQMIRLDRAEQLLKSERYSVKEVAIMCGFDNFSYFTACFKKRTGLAPSRYLTQKRKMSQHNG